jgi:UDP-N-acetylmuramoyl-tripeptide--D-alanyl-D-alanine ligase
MNKSKKLQLLERIMRFMARAVIRKYEPIIIGITGSVGKTSTKEAVALVLSSKYRVRKNEKNYNNEVGIPLTIIGVQAGGHSVFRWGWVAVKWMALVLFPCRYPEILVLEMGIDRPGDMDYLTSFIPVTVGIITTIATSHLEFFKNIDHIAREKGKIINDIPLHGLAILNADDERVVALKDKVKIPVLTYGFSKDAHVKGVRQSLDSEGIERTGIQFKLNYEGKAIPIRLPHVVAEHLVYATLAAIAAGIYFKINLVEIAETLEKFSLPPGRMNLLSGIKRSFIIDDTYNSSPKSTVAALEVLRTISGGRKIAVLGDMLELGEDLERGHKEVAEKVFAIKVDLFFAIGKRMEIAMQYLISLGYPTEKILYFSDLEIMGRKLQAEISEGDVILVKGSQGMRLEKVVEEIMAEPLRAEELLCRQGREWRNMPLNMDNFQ